MSLATDLELIVGKVRKIEETHRSLLFCARVLVDACEQQGVTIIHPRGKHDLVNQLRGAVDNLTSPEVRERQKAFAQANTEEFRK